MADGNHMKSDTGYIFAGPKTIDATKPLKNGTVLEDSRFSGVIVSENPQSPWHQATCFAFGTTVKDTDGNLVQEAALYEMTDADGDVTWSIYWNPADGPGTFEFVQGMGKWENITGHGKDLGVVNERADGHSMPRWELSWEVGKEEVERATFDPEAYPESDTSLSFHGPHVTRTTKELSNGLTLIYSSQSGILLSDNIDAVSPRNRATVFDRGTTIKTAGGKNLGDVMLLEDQDPDGDLAWLIHIWWYGKGPGWYKFLGGTGKWKGIAGGGQTLGMLAPRVDDHYMLKSQVHWRVDT